MIPICYPTWTRVNRIEKAIDCREPIVIYGDYDADGITAASMLYLFLKKQGADVEIYIPNRYTEGYDEPRSHQADFCPGDKIDHKR